MSLNVLVAQLTPWTVARRLLCPWGFPRNPGIEPRSPTLGVASLPAEPLGKPKNTGLGGYCLLRGIFQAQGSNLGLLH